MKILIIAPYYYPLENPRAYRWKQIVNHLIEQGADVTVLTADDHLETSEPTVETIIRTGFSTPDKRWTETGTADRKVIGGKWLRSLARKLMWPDESKFWIKPALQKAKTLLDQDKYDWVISVSHPFSSHVIASKLKSSYSFKWMVDIGDPFTHHDAAPRNSRLLWERRNRVEEKFVLTRCDVLTVTNTALRDLYLTEHGKEVNVKVIGPMSSPTVNHEIEQARSKSTIALGYFGTFYDGIRPPNNFIKFLNEINVNTQVEVYLFGDIKVDHKTVLKENCPRGVELHFMETVPRKEVLGKMKKMDALIQLGNSNPYQLASKWADYIVAQRPIINVYENEYHLPNHWSEYNIHSWPLGNEKVSDLNQIIHFSSNQNAEEFLPISIAKSYSKLLKI